MGVYMIGNTIAFVMSRKGEGCFYKTNVLMSGALFLGCSVAALVFIDKAKQAADAKYPPFVAWAGYNSCVEGTLQITDYQADLYN